MQETTKFGPAAAVPRDNIPGQSLVTLLALVGTGRMDVEALRARTKLTPPAFGSLLRWLQREYLVDVVSSPEGKAKGEEVVLTEKGEAALVSMLEETCELPELR
jgi:DNA-binding MarR family transcriptional regulator